MSQLTKKFKVVGGNTMHCSGCESTVKFALQQLPGMENVHANHKNQIIEVTFEPQILPTEKIFQELDWIGYQVEEEEE